MILKNKLILSFIKDAILYPNGINKEMSKKRNE